MEKSVLMKSIPYFLNLALPSSKIWVDYDDDVDVLYISFKKPQNANDSIMENSFIYHYNNEQLVGLTVLNAQKNYPMT